MANYPWDTQQQKYRACLKQIRSEATLTQSELALLLGKPQSYISKYESGERKLDYLEVRSICKACKTTIFEFERLLIGALGKQ